jgi:hypothetical protein
MRHHWSGVVLAVTVLLTAAPATSAHHSVSGVFDQAKSITLKGVISRVEWINPHVYVHLDVKEENGTVTWAWETLPTAMLRKAGLTKESVMGKPGEIVTITGIPARDESRRLAFIYRITYSDGRHYQLGSAGL